MMDGVSSEMKKLDYVLLFELTRNIPDNLDRKTKKEVISKKVREVIVERDKYTCQLCSHSDKEHGYGNVQYGIAGSLHIHHIIPNGKATESNLVTLCDKCHKVIHLLLYLDGKWKWIP